MLTFVTTFLLTMPGRLVHRAKRDEAGAEIIEYLMLGLVAVVVAVIIQVAMKALGTDVMQSIRDQIGL